MYKFIFADVFTIHAGFLVFIYICQSTCTHYRSFKEWDKCVVKEEFISSNFTARSKLECVAGTTSRGLNTASWHLASNTCRASDTREGTDLWHVNCDWMPGWTIFEYKRFRVFLARGPYFRFNMTFAQAQHLCGEYGTTLANPEDMIEAKAMGFEICACGWLSDETNGFVMQTYVSSCWKNNAKGINYCGYTRADAYCLY